MASTLAHGLNYIAQQQIKQIIKNLNTDEDELYSTVSYPLIYTPANQNTKNQSPFVMVSPVGVNPTITTNSLNNVVGPIGTQVTYGTYSDLNKDKRILKQIVKYFLYKILDKWLYNDLKNILAFVKITDDKPALIRSMSDYKPESLNSESVENIDKRADYLSKILISKELVKHVLKKFVDKNDIKWIQLDKNKSIIKKVFKKYLYSKLEEAVKSAKQ